MRFWVSENLSLTLIFMFNIRFCPSYLEFEGWKSKSHLKLKVSPANSFYSQVSQTKTSITFPSISVFENTLHIGTAEMRSNC